MVKKFTTAFLVLSTAVAVSAAPASNAKDIAMFPAANEGMERFVIRLPAIKNAADSKIEIRAGKTMAIDCNRHFMGQNLTQHDLQGWGYNYWVVTDLPVASTLMACAGAKPKLSFVSGNAEMIAYNSQLPIIVYATQGVFGAVSRVDRRQNRKDRSNVVAFLATKVILFAIAQKASLRQIASIGGETPKHILIGGHSPPLPPLAELTNGLHAQRGGRIRLQLYFPHAQQNIQPTDDGFLFSHLSTAKPHGCG